MLVISPPEEIGRAYEQNVEPLEVMIAALVKKNIVLRKICNFLLPRIISGELDVSDLSIETGVEAA